MPARPRIGGALRSGEVEASLAKPEVTENGGGHASTIGLITSQSTPAPASTVPVNRRRHTGTASSIITCKLPEHAGLPSHASAPSSHLSPASPPIVRKRQKTNDFPSAGEEESDLSILSESEPPSPPRVLRSRSITDLRSETLAVAFASRTVQLDGGSCESSATSLGSPEPLLDFRLPTVPAVEVTPPRSRMEASAAHTAESTPSAAPSRSLTSLPRGQSVVFEPTEVISWNAVQHNEPPQQFDSPIGSTINLAAIAESDTDKPAPPPLHSALPPRAPPPALDRRPTVPWIPPIVENPAPAESGGTIWEYFKGELFGSDFDDSPDVKKERIQNFLAVPYELEKLMFFGCVICFDSFLHIFTILPLRLIIAVWTTLKSMFASNARLTSSQKCDLMKGSLIVICCYMLQHYDASRIYHSVRGQALIKLYVIFNSLEICDKLCSAFGHDILDSLFSKATVSYSLQNPQHANRHFGRVKHFATALCYVFTHSLVLFYQVMTLNVAVNSYNNALLTLLMSNQFVEIKGSVFKRFERENLFQLSCADIVERFQLFVFLCIITLRNLIELTGGLSSLDSAISYFYSLSASMFAPSTFLADSTFFSSRSVEFPSASTVLAALYAVFTSPAYKLFETLATPVVVVFGTEVLVDWLKHAFISKFNQIKPAVYERFTDSLCRDLAAVRAPPPPTAPTSSTEPLSAPQPPPRARMFVDQSPAVARRIGFVSIPLSCLVIRVTIQTMQMLIYLRSPVLEVVGPPPPPVYEPFVLALRRAADAWMGTSLSFSSDGIQELGATVLRSWNVFVEQWPWGLLWELSLDVATWAVVVAAVYLGLLATKLAVGMRMHRAARQRCNDLDRRPSPAAAPPAAAFSGDGTSAGRPRAQASAEPPPSAIHSTWASRRPSSASVAPDPLPPPAQPAIKPDKLDTVDRFTMVKSRIV
ncbi:hypothetical protein HDU87_000414 [Geranomyces variabilis]|uniref:Eukaryotic membrane protein family-domain-containing protein n=1 Tax=Geranomyces variabilis TaxID=109894 RepID=A0AAD5XPE7_9FUNG|nr:hypothetical protein HDU87_000414 [Geranomyces variabilis]